MSHDCDCPDKAATFSICFLVGSFQAIYDILPFTLLDSLISEDVDFDNIHHL